MQQNLYQMVEGGGGCERGPATMQPWSGSTSRHSMRQKKIIQIIKKEREREKKMELNSCKRLK